jgi:hypothetical protein
MLDRGDPCGYNHDDLPYPFSAEIHVLTRRFQTALLYLACLPAMAGSVSGRVSVPADLWLT